MTQVYVKLTKTRLCLGLPPTLMWGAGVELHPDSRWGRRSEMQRVGMELQSLVLLIQMLQMWGLKSIWKTQIGHSAQWEMLAYCTRHWAYPDRKNKQTKNQPTHRKRKPCFLLGLLCQGIFSHRQDSASGQTVVSAMLSPNTSSLSVSLP